jgi:hypothetical protein
VRNEFFPIGFYSWCESLHVNLKSKR